MPGWPQPALPTQWTGTANLPPFVGRRRELATLEEIWPSVERGARQVVFVGGEAGTGKSRLVMEAALALDRNGVSVLVGSCTADLGLPFDPLVNPLRRLLAALEAGEVDPVDDAATDPEEAVQLLRLMTDGSSPRGPRGQFDGMALNAALSVLAGACHHGPMLLVLEDLQWAGESGLRGLRFLVERSAELPILVLVTHRNTQPDRSELFSEVAADLMRLPGVQRIDLEGLDTDEVAEYLTAARAGDVQAVRWGAALLRDHTGGNAFMLGEVWRDLERRGGLARLAARDVQVPEPLRTLVARRMSGLDPAGQRLVRVGAVIGDDFTVDLVRASVGEDRSSAGEVFDSMAAACAEGLVEAIPSRLGAYRFPHALARQAVLDLMKPFELASTHASVGFALEEGFLADETRLQRLAHHFANASGLGLEDRAVRYLEESAATAMARLANSDAATLFERAAGFAHEPPERDRLLLCAARCHHLAGHMSQALELDERVSTSGDRGHRLAAAIGYEAASWRGGFEAVRAVELLQTALSSTALDDSDPTHIRALAALGSALALSGRRAESAPHLERALAAARRSGDEQLLMAILQKCITMRADVTPERGLERLRGQLAAADEVTELAKRRGSLRPLAAAAQMRLLGAYILGDPAALDSAGRDLALMFTVTRQPYWRWSAYLDEGSRSIMRCQFDQAARILAEGRVVESSFEEVTGRAEGPWSLQSFMLRRETGGLDFARPVLEASWPPTNPWRPGLVAICTELGMAERARSVLQEAVERDLGRLRESSTWPAALCFLGEAAAWLQEREYGQLFLREAECFAGLNLVGAEFLATLGSGDRLLAILRSSLGLPGVEEHFAAALEMDQRMGSTLHVATTQAEWAAHLRRSHAPSSRVEEHAAPARELADSYDLVRVRRILGQDASSSPPPLPDGLTARELDVLRLIGLGRSNRDIAGDLFISEYTAANHVRSILMKTHCPNRTAAAHYAMRHGLLPAGSDHGQQ